MTAVWCDRVLPDGIKRREVKVDSVTVVLRVWQRCGWADTIAEWGMSLLKAVDAEMSLLFSFVAGKVL